MNEPTTLNFGRTLLAVLILATSLATPATAGLPATLRIDCPETVTHRMDPIRLSRSQIPENWHEGPYYGGGGYVFGKYPVIAAYASGWQLICHYGVPRINQYGARIVGYGYALEGIRRDLPYGYACVEDSSVASIGFTCTRL